MRLTGKTKLRVLGRHLKGVGAGTTVVVGLSELDRHREALREIGLPASASEGDTVLPKPLGPTSLFNAEGGEIIHKDRPKETVYYQREWTWQQWHGQTTIPRSKIVDIPYERFPRTPISPPSVELTLARDISGELVVVTPPLDYTPANEVALLHRINLLRELFGEAEILTADLKPLTGLKRRRLNWEILPAGELPWPQVKQRVEPFLRELGEVKGPAAEFRLRLLTKTFEPDFFAEGLAGFSGYFVFGFAAKGLYVVESLQYGNATYVFDDDWEPLSQLTKAEILAGNLHKQRIIHTEGWAETVRELLR